MKLEGVRSWMALARPPVQQGRIFRRMHTSVTLSIYLLFDVGLT